jgi:competence protein ComEC
MRPLRKRRELKWLEPILILIGLWGFSLLAGAQPSVLRSAVMFTCIVLSNSIARKSSIYNTLAFSAFILLCYNPYWLWDAGFQLSYFAVLSIIIFMKPMYNLIFVRNRFLDMVWKLNAVTIAAQILTVPVSIFHFHQFPNYFILTNIVAVPLSSGIVLGEILLCALSFIPVIATLIGKVLGWCIWLMNSYVELIEQLPASIWQGLQIDIVQTILLYLVITTISTWLMAQRISGLKWAFIFLFGFFSIRAFSFFEKKNQSRLIVYNVPGKSVIDIYTSRQILCTADKAMEQDEFILNFHLKPSRILHRTPVSSTGSICQDKLVINGKKIWRINQSIERNQRIQSRIDVLVLCRNTKLFLKEFVVRDSVGIVVFDGSVSAGRLKYWKKDCEFIGIPFHDVGEKGAFVMNLN